MYMKPRAFQRVLNNRDAVARGATRITFKAIRMPATTPFLLLL
jgi:hypothetical protein